MKKTIFFLNDAAARKKILKRTEKFWTRKFRFATRKIGGNSPRIEKIEANLVAIYILFL